MPTRRKSNGVDKRIEGYSFGSCSLKDTAAAQRDVAVAAGRDLFEASVHPLCLQAIKASFLQPSKGEKKE